jgi:D-alanyl-D-alanine carboxypeptidase (penicillin-binding protein 5/6)
MNNFVKKIGANNTNIINPHGLDADNHYTTAYDLGIITSYALKNDLFREIVSTKNAVISGNEKVEARYLKHKNKLLFVDDNCIGVKTGFTDNAGRCLVHATKQENGMEIITVLLNCSPMFEEANRLNNIALNNYEFVEFVKPYNFVGIVNINNGSSNTTNVATIKGYYDVVKKDDKNKYLVEYDIPNNIDAPIKNGDVVGSVTVKFENDIVFKGELISIDSVDNIDMKYMLDNILNKWYA